jgi:virginiamycin B lyase
MPVSLWHDLSSITPTAQVKVLAPDAAGAVWYFNSDGKDFVRIDAASHSQTVYPFSGITWAIAMTVAPDGIVWFSNPLNTSLGALDPRTGTITYHRLTGVLEAPTSLAVGADGSIWFGDAATEQLGRLDTTGALTLLAEPTSNDVNGVASTADGRIWYSRGGTDGVGVYDPATGSFSDAGLTAGTGSEITVSKTGDVWAASYDADSAVSTFSRITPTGAVTSFPVSAPGTAAVLPADISAGENSDIVFLDPSYGFGTVDASGAVSFSRLDGTRTSIVLDPQGHLWVNDRFSDNLLWS